MKIEFILTDASRGPGKGGRHEKNDIFSIEEYSLCSKCGISMIILDVKSDKR